MGSAPNEETMLENLREKNFSDKLINAMLFYCRGALDMQKMKGLDKMAMNMFVKMISKKDSADIAPSEASLLENLNGAHDWTDKDNLAPIISYLHAKPSSTN